VVTVRIMATKTVDFSDIHDASEICIEAKKVPKPTIHTILP
jgi:hypothetical protein